MPSRPRSSARLTYEDCWARSQSAPPAQRRMVINGMTFSPSQLAVLDHHGLRLGEELAREATAFAANAALPDATERLAQVAVEERVDPQRARTPVLGHGV